MTPKTEKKIKEFTEKALALSKEYGAELEEFTEYDQEENPCGSTIWVKIDGEPFPLEDLFKGE